tara:strand:- start:164 stop:502 length:339 start_codon:yes stop_codon:yes gene_type:complete
MALTWTKTVSARFDGFSAVGYWLGVVEFDNSYPTAGEAFTEADLGFSTLYHLSLTVDQGDSAAEFWSIAWDKSEKKLQAYGGSGGTTTALDEVANTDNLSTFSVDVFAIGLN